MPCAGQGRSSPQAEADKVVPPGPRVPSWEEAQRPSEKQLVSPTGISTSTAHRLPPPRAKRVSWAPCLQGQSADHGRAH